MNVHLEEDGEKQYDSLQCRQTLWTCDLSIIVNKVFKETIKLLNRMSILVQSVSMQQLKHEFESFLKRFYRKLLVLQPQIYIVSNVTKDAVQLQVTWKSISANGYVTYNTCTTYKSDYMSAINQMRRISDYSLKDAELLADSPFVDIFFGMQPIQQEIENSPLEELLTSVN